jgi:lipopolysaccharide transport system ATP-binding protein
MTNAISVENIGKKYRLGHEVKRAANTREAVKNALSTPFRYLKYRMSDATDEDTLWACRNISFEVKRGEVLGIVGANGAGKSTLLKILSRITDPSEGRAVIHGRVNALLEVGVGFHPELTGRENIYLNAALHCLTARETRAKLDEIVDFSGVERFLDTPVKRYSSGMKVRLGFAVAAHLEPEILIVDEVLAVGDAEFQAKCLGKMESVTEAGRTVLFVSHNMVAVQNLCGQAIWLERGTVHMRGEATEVVARYLASNQVLALERSWDNPAEAPGIPELKLSGISVRNMGGQHQGIVVASEPIKITLQYRQFTDSSDELRCNMNLINEQGVMLFVASSYMAYREEKLGTQAGQYTFSFEIPRHILNSGVYMIKLSILRNGAVTWSSDKVLAFEVADMLKRESHSYKKFKGVIRPELTYDLSYQA